MFLSRPRPSLVTIQANKIDRSLFECLELVSFPDLLPSELTPFLPPLSFQATAIVL
jgi:hypothetical protein